MTVCVHFYPERERVIKSKVNPDFLILKLRYENYFLFNRCPDCDELVFVV